jgi:cytochrome P450
MNPPEQHYYRQALNPYLSPAAMSRWIPFIGEFVRACVDEKIEDGRIDFVDDLTDVVPAVVTLAMTGIPLQNWRLYSEPVHTAVHTPPTSPDMTRVGMLVQAMLRDLVAQFTRIRKNPRPGLASRSG